MEDCQRRTLHSRTKEHLIHLRTHIWLSRGKVYTTKILLKWRAKVTDTLKKPVPPCFFEIQRRVVKIVSLSQYLKKPEAIPISLESQFFPTGKMKKKQCFENKMRKRLCRKRAKHFNFAKHFFHAFVACENNHENEGVTLVLSKKLAEKHLHNSEKNVGLFHNY